MACSQCIRIDGYNTISTSENEIYTFNLTIESSCEEYADYDINIDLVYDGGDAIFEDDFFAPSNVTIRAGTRSTAFDIFIAKHAKNESVFVISLSTIDLFHGREILQCENFGVQIINIIKKTTPYKYPETCCDFVPKNYELWMQYFHCTSDD